MLRVALLISAALMVTAPAANAYDETQNWLNAYGRTVEHFSTPDRSLQTALISAENVVTTVTRDSGKIPERGIQQTGAWPWSGDSTRGSYDHQGSFTGRKIELEIPGPAGYLAATVWAPSDARLRQLRLKAPLPGIVYAPGVISGQPMYYWFAQDMADAGYVVMTYDLEGQGRSQGYQSGSHPKECLEAALAFFASDANPLRGMLDVARIGTAGHSLGAVAVQQVGDAGGLVKAISAHSDMQAGYTGSAPLQGQGADYESFVFPPQPSPGSDPGEKLVPFEAIAASSPVDLQEIVIESATHMAWSHVTWAYTSVWSEPVAFWYSLAWFDRYLYGDLARKDGIPTPTRSGGLKATTRLTSNYEAIPGHGLSKKFRSAYRVGSNTCGDMVARTGCTQPKVRKATRSARKAARRHRSGRAAHRR